MIDVTRVLFLVTISSAIAQAGIATLSLSGILQRTRQQLYVSHRDRLGNSGTLIAIFDGTLGVSYPDHCE